MARKRPPVPQPDCPAPSGPATLEVSFTVGQPAHASGTNAMKGDTLRVLGPQMGVSYPVCGTWSKSQDLIGYGTWHFDLIDPSGVTLVHREVTINDPGS